MLTPERFHDLFLDYLYDLLDEADAQAVREYVAANPAAKVELGRYLYFDRRLSADETVSCASCHDPKHGFTDGAAVSTGIKSQKGNRSAPTVINRAFSLAQFQGLS